MKKFIISSDALKPALKKLSLAINSKPVLPVLSNIYVLVTKGQVELFTSDLELTIRYQLPAESKESFEMLLPFDFFNKLIHTFKSAPVTIELVDKKKAVITGDNEDYDVSLADIKTYPEVPPLPIQNVIRIKEGFVDLLSKAMESTAGEHSNPAISHACLDIKSKEAFLVSTDTHIMYKHKMEVEAKEPGELLFSSKFASAIEGLKDFELSWTKQKIVAKSGGLTVWSTRYDGKYVNYSAVIQSIPVSIKLNKHDLIDVMTKACLSSDKVKHTHIYLKREPAKIHIEFDDPDFGRKGHLVIAGEYSGDTEMIGVNAAKMITVLKQIDEDEINLHIGSATRAVLVSADEDPDYLGLIMPIMPNI